MAERRIPTRQEVLAYLHERRNWGRWGVVGGTGSPANPIALF